MAVGKRKVQGIVTLGKEMGRVRREDGDALGIAENLAKRPRA